MPPTSQLLTTGRACCPAISGRYSDGCEHASDSDFRSWSDTGGLQGIFASGSGVSFGCCPYEYSCYRHTDSAGAGGTVDIGSSGLSVSESGCMGNEHRSCDVTIEVAFDRPMRMPWPDCRAGSDVGYAHGCPFDDGGFPQEGPCERGGVGFPHAEGVGLYCQHRSRHALILESRAELRRRRRTERARHLGHPVEAGRSVRPAADRGRHEPRRAGGGR